MLTLDTAAEHLEAGILVSYTPGMKPIRDVPGNQAEAVEPRIGDERNAGHDPSPEVEQSGHQFEPGI